MIARCAGEDRFFAVSNLIYEKQREWTASGAPAIVIEELRKLEKTAGMNDVALDACMSDADQAQALVGWYQANAERDSVSSTPSFLIDGENFSNMAYPDFQKILDEKLG
jgi:protein-disulfide isomerase